MHKDLEERRQYARVYRLKTKDAWKDRRREYARRYREKHPERVKQGYKKADLKRNHGLSLEWFNYMFEKQKGCCKICGVHQSELSRALHVDHCHVTGKVRHLLCLNCNHLIGKAKEDTKILSAAIKYLEENK